MKSWGEEVWERKSKAHGDAGVILGTGFTKSDLDTNTKRILGFLESSVLKSLESGAELLDAGIGPAARIAIPLAQAGFHITGCDISGNTIRLAKSRVEAEGLSQRVHFQQVDLVEMNLGREFDAIYCVETFFHLPGHLQLLAFQSFHRHLKSGGQLVVQFAVQERITVSFLAYSLFYHSVYKLASPLFRLFGRESFYTNVTRVSSDEVFDIAERSGFRVGAPREAGLFVFSKR